MSTRPTFTAPLLLLLTLSAGAQTPSPLAQVQSLRSSSDLAVESLHLTLLRYRAGEAIALQVVDGRSTAALARGAYDDGLVRYRVAPAGMQDRTGNL